VTSPAVGARPTDEHPVAWVPSAAASSLAERLPEAGPAPVVWESRPLLGLLLAMTLATGPVDAASYLGLGHVFVANMTGTVVLLGFALAGAAGLSPSTQLVALLAFLAAAGAGGRLAARAGRRLRAWLLAETTLGDSAAGVLNVRHPAARYGPPEIAALARPESLPRTPTPPAAPAATATRPATTPSRGPTPSAAGRGA
jgi:Protein of unknown function (DUF1275)